MDNFNEIAFERAVERIRAYLKSAYNRSGRTFGPADPHGQIIDVLAALNELNILYVKRAKQSLDINDPGNNDVRMIRSIARLGQYDPSRSRAATGTLRLTLKPGVDPAEDIPGGSITLFNRMLLRNESNGLDYNVDIGADRQSYTVEKGGHIIVPIVQGKWYTSTFTGTGKKSQSFSLQSRGSQDVDNDRYDVYVSSALWMRRRGLTDMLPQENAYYARTGIDSSMDVFFGNGDLGGIPALGAPVEVRYMKTDGAAGNVPNPRTNDFKFVDEVVDAYGEAVDVESVFDVDVEPGTIVGYGADGESADEIKANLPLVFSGDISKPEHVEFYFKRMGVFSTVKAYKDRPVTREAFAKIAELAKTNTDMLKDVVATAGSDATIRNLIRANIETMQRTLTAATATSAADSIKVVLVPDITVFYGSKSGFDYFDVPVSAFSLAQTEKDRLLTGLDATGLLSITTDVEIVEPVVSKYIANITVRMFDWANEKSVRNAIRSGLSSYMIGFKRTDRLPPSDIIRLVEEVSGVDSADVSFVSERNERYHGEYEERRAAFFEVNQREPNAGEILMSDGSRYDENRIIGLDPILGDAIFENSDLPLVRGGWKDRNGVFYTDGYGPGLSSVNVVFVNPRGEHLRIFIVFLGEEPTMH
jgi:hypothetical protein